MPDLPPGSQMWRAIDPEARDGIASFGDRLRDIERKLGDLSHVTWGVDHRNGLRSVVKAHSKRLKLLRSSLDVLRREWEDWRDIERPKTCIGKAELEKHIAEHESMSAQQIALELARINAEERKAEAQAEAEEKKRAERLKFWAAVLVAAFAAGSTIYNSWQQAQLQLLLKGVTVVQGVPSGRTIAPEPVK